MSGVLSRLNKLIAGRRETTATLTRHRLPLVMRQITHRKT